MSDPYTPAQWHQILTNAHAALAADPTNARARAALKAAVTAVTTENASIKQQEAAAAQQPEPGTVGSAVTGFGEGASLGLASRLGNLLPGPSNSAYLAAARQAHPVATFGGDLAGGVATGALLAAAPLLAGLSPVAKGVAVGGLLGAGRGAVEAPEGARLLGAGAGGALGAATGYVGGKVVGKITPALSTILKNLRGAPAAAAEAVAPAGTAEEIAVAKQLGLTLDQVRGRVGARPAINQAPLLPALRGAPDPLDAPAFARNARPAEPLASGLLPYYPRGGAAEQALPPSPVQSAPVIGPASPEVIVRSSSYADLMQALEQPALTARARQAILGELQRRGIVGSGLLAPAAR
jgi:hypothetical protein